MSPPIPFRWFSGWTLFLEWNNTQKQKGESHPLFAYNGSEKVTGKITKFLMGVFGRISITAVVYFDHDGIFDVSISFLGIRTDLGRSIHFSTDGRSFARLYWIVSRIWIALLLTLPVGPFCPPDYLVGFGFDRSTDFALRLLLRVEAEGSPKEE